MPTRKTAKKTTWKLNKRSKAKHARALAKEAPGGKGRIKKRKTYKSKVW